MHGKNETKSVPFERLCKLRCVFVITVLLFTSDHVPKISLRRVNSIYHLKCICIHTHPPSEEVRRELKDNKCGASLLLDSSDTQILSEKCGWSGYLTVEGVCRPLCKRQKRSQNFELGCCCPEDFIVCLSFTSNDTN